MFLFEFLHAVVDLELNKKFFLQKKVNVLKNPKSSLNLMFLIFFFLGGGGFRLKPQMKVSFVWMWPYRILDERAQKECSWRVHVVHVLLQISWLAGALLVIIATLATSRASWSTQTTLKPSSSSWQQFLFASCVVCWWHEVWAPFQGRRTTL